MAFCQVSFWVMPFATRTWWGRACSSHAISPCGRARSARRSVLHYRSSRRWRTTRCKQHELFHRCPYDTEMAIYWLNKTMSKWIYKSLFMYDQKCITHRCFLFVLVKHMQFVCLSYLECNVASWSRFSVCERLNIARWETMGMTVCFPFFVSLFYCSTFLVICFIFSFLGVYSPGVRTAWMGGHMWAHRGVFFAMRLHMVVALWSSGQDMVCLCWGHFVDHVGGTLVQI